MRAQVRFTIASILLTAVGAFAQAVKTNPPDLPTIVSRMQAAMSHRNQDRAYSITREYKLVPEDEHKASTVMATVNAVASGEKEYRITEGNGEAEKVVRKVLDHETQPPSELKNAELSSDNYEFAYSGKELIDGHTCHVLQLLPKHDAKDLIKGKAWVDSETYLVRQLEGSPAKNPSWWIKDLKLKLHYTDVDGLWLQDSVEAVAQVRMIGKRTLLAKDVDVRSDVAVASAPRKQHATRRVDPALLGAGVFQRR